MASASAIDTLTQVRRRSQGFIPLGRRGSGLLSRLRYNSPPHEHTVPLGEGALPAVSLALLEWFRSDALQGVGGHLRARRLFHLFNHLRKKNEVEPR